MVSGSALVKKERPAATTPLPSFETDPADAKANVRAAPPYSKQGKREKGQNATEIVFFFLFLFFHRDWTCVCVWVGLGCGSRGFPRTWLKNPETAPASHFAPRLLSRQTPGILLLLPFPTPRSSKPTLQFGRFVEDMCLLSVLKGLFSSWECVLGGTKRSVNLRELPIPSAQGKKQNQSNPHFFFRAESNGGKRFCFCALNRGNGVFFFTFCACQTVVRKANSSPKPYGGNASF
ncbi:uncharacterized protein TM35_000261760 [Trypanosoma theileri]|uniref:Uncharacterized protein n=1 Tax=Trypanosoma theileri TaxID=67003 RepID=A0A1X0NPV2_9TRYP|nr:uncharacterized protein TM35_000261760 [Trypanosoma theileri]ORC86724.1 hypothetical protein TM35_000261760 [Trypanosoma theileri]